MIEGISIGVVANTFYDLLKPFGREALHRRHHRHGLKRLISGKKTKSTTDLEKAIDDLTRFLGNVEGRYNTSTATLLAAMKTDANIQFLIEAIILDYNISAYKPYFHAFFLRFHPSATLEETEHFFSLFVHSLALSFEIRGNRPTKYEFDRTFSKQILQRLDRIDAALANIRADKATELGAQLDNYARSASRSYSRLLVPTVHGNQEVDINDIFIPSRISTASSTQSFLAPRSRIAGGVTSRFSRKQLLSSIERGGRFLILGDPGGGKSTLGQNICAEVSADGRFLAVRVRLRDHAKSVRQSRWNIFESLKSEIQLSADAAEPSDEFVSHHLGAGRLLVFFDGLDEITNAKERLYAASSIQKFSENNPANPIIVTSRLIGFDNATLPDFYRLVIRPFTNSDVRHYVSLYMQKLAKNKIRNSAQLEKYVERFVKQTATQAKELRDNPLMLSLICGMYDDEKGNIPDNRAKIYEECAKLVYVRWDRERKIDSSTLQREDFFNLISDIASDVYPKEELQAGVDFRWLVDKVESLLSDLYDDPVKKSREFSETICRELAERTWVFIPTPDGSYEFAHRTFLEFFFARYLRDQNPDAQHLLGEHERELKSREWVLPLHLALQMAVAGGRRSSDRASLELERIGILLSEKDANQVESTNLALFVADALAYLPCAEAIFRRLVDFVLDELVDKKLAVAQEPDLASIISIGNCTQDRGAFATKLLEAYLDDKIFSLSENSLLFALFLRDYEKTSTFVKTLFDRLSEKADGMSDLKNTTPAWVLVQFVFRPTVYLKEVVALGGSIFRDHSMAGRTADIVSGLFSLLKTFGSEQGVRKSLLAFCEDLAASLPLRVYSGAAKGAKPGAYLEYDPTIRSTDPDEDYDLAFAFMVFDIIEAAISVGYKDEGALRYYFSDYAFVVMHMSVTRDCRRRWAERDDIIDARTAALKKSDISESVKRDLFHRCIRGNRILSARGQ